MPGVGVKMEKITLLLGMPRVNAIYREIIADLNAHGFEVVDFSYEEHLRVQYLSWFHRLKTKWRQYVLRDNKAKLLAKSEAVWHRIRPELERRKAVDYALFIRGDIYHPRMLQKIRSYVRCGMLNYQWDGMDRFPLIWDCLADFDKCYVFDGADLNKASGILFPATNFYFDHIDTAAEETSDFYFLGAHVPGRDDVIRQFAEQAGRLDWKLDFNIVCYQEKEMSVAREVYPAESIHLRLNPFSFAENLAAVQRAKVLVDFKTPAHNGLSFRVFEALGYRKKLITTNTEVEKYDFYHPDNIFIWDGCSFDGIDDFLKRPCYELDAAIREKYSFGNWIRYILDLPPYLPIGLPEGAAVQAN